METSLFEEIWHISSLTCSNVQHPQESAIHKQLTDFTQQIWSLVFLQDFSVPGLPANKNCQNVFLLKEQIVVKKEDKAFLAFPTFRSAKAAFGVSSPSTVSAWQKASEAPTPTSFITRLLLGLSWQLAHKAEVVSQRLLYSAAVEDKGKKCTYKIDRSTNRDMNEIKMNRDNVPKAE